MTLFTSVQEFNGKYVNAEPSNKFNFGTNPQIGLNMILLRNIYELLRILFSARCECFIQDVPLYLSISLFLFFFLHKPECVHVASEEGDYSYKKATNTEESSKTCGLYILTDADKFVEISIKYLDAGCNTGALLAVNIDAIQIDKIKCFCFHFQQNYHFHNSFSMAGSLMESISPTKRIINYH